MTSQIKPVDIFSTDLRVPLTVAIYCRNRKHCTASVNLNRALVAQQNAKMALILAQQAYENAQEKVMDCVKSAEEFMHSQGER